MADKILKSFEVWIAAQGVKSRTRLRSVDNISLEGIARLRELILDLAVRGKLVKQDLKDEAVSILLEKIRIEKEKLIKEGIAKKDRDFPEINEKEKPFELPHGWQWVRIETIGHDWGQREPKEDFSYIEVSGIDSEKGIIESTTVLSATDAPSRARKIVKKGSIIYSTVRPYLKNICLIDKDYTPDPIASTAFAVIHPYQSMPGEYFLHYFRSPVFIKYVESIQVGVAYPAINDKQFFGGLVPLPPIAEQHRIVAKVEELMALCDELERQETHHLKSHALLVETLLGTLTQAKDAKEFQQAWSLLAQHFDDLFTTEDSIDQLKQTILQLAVMGKLVPQDPKDEPAIELLAKIESERKKLVTEGKIKKIRSTELISDNYEIAFELPSSWILCSLGDLIESINNGLYKPESFYLSDGIISLRMYNIQNGVIDLTDCRRLKLNDEELSIYELHENDILVNRVNSAELVGKSAIIKDIDEPIVYESMNMRLRLYFKDLIADYVNLYFQSSFVRVYLTQILKQAIGQASINQTQLRGLQIPLPPPSEQKRIVSKVNQLFALCDELKARLAAAQTLANQLAEGVVENV